jgi:single-strand DNA-binding protein
MSSYNRVIVMGNLTRDPELKFLPSGTAVCELAIAINENYKDKEGKTVESVVFVEIVVWGKQAESVNTYLTKGASALVEGRLQLDQWESKEGEKRSKMRVRADRVVFVGGGKRADEHAPHRPQDQNPEPPDASDPDLPF